MANAFDSANYPESEPAELIAGDRWVWKRTDLGSDYPPASYALSYVARREDTGFEITINASESGSDYLVEVAKATTIGYPAGRYYWQAYITRSSDSERVTVSSGTFEVIADRDTDTADPRSHARKVLAAIEAVIEGRASRDQEEYSIGGRSLKRTPIEDLLKLRDKYVGEVDAEQRKANGQGSRKLLYRF